jgi:hypothetical protein
VRARFLTAVRKQLTAHVGGNPNFVQRQLIERGARLTLYVEMLDARSLKAGSMSDHDQKQYLAWSNSLVRVLRDLGIEAAAARSIPCISLASRRSRKRLRTALAVRHRGWRRCWNAIPNW